MVRAMNMGLGPEKKSCGLEMKSHGIPRKSFSMKLLEYCDLSDGCKWPSKYGKIWLTTGHIPAMVVMIPKVHQYGRWYHMMVLYIQLIRHMVDSPSQDMLQLYVLVDS